MLHKRCTKAWLISYCCINCLHLILVKAWLDIYGYGGQGVSENPLCNLREIWFWQLCCRGDQGGRGVRASVWLIRGSPTQPHHSLCSNPKFCCFLVSCSSLLIRGAIAQFLANQRVTGTFAQPHHSLYSNQNFGWFPKIRKELSKFPCSLDCWHIHYTLYAIHYCLSLSMFVLISSLEKG